MAIIKAKGRNTLGTLGTLADLAGMATGTPWLSTLGLGMGAVGKMINGDDMTNDQRAGLQEILGKISEWINPAKDNNIGKVKISDEELAKKWSPYLDTAGYDGWGY